MPCLFPCGAPLGVNMCNKGIAALAPALRELKNLVDLKLHGSRFTGAGLRELCDIALFPIVENKDILPKKGHHGGIGRAI